MPSGGNKASSRLGEPSHTFTDWGSYSQKNLSKIDSLPVTTASRIAANINPTFPNPLLFTPYHGSLTPLLASNMGGTVGGT